MIESLFTTSASAAQPPVSQAASTWLYARSGGRAQELPVPYTVPSTGRCELGLGSLVGGERWRRCDRDPGGGEPVRQHRFALANMPAQVAAVACFGGLNTTFSQHSRSTCPGAMACAMSATTINGCRVCCLQGCTARQRPARLELRNNLTHVQAHFLHNWAWARDARLVPLMPDSIDAIGHAVIVIATFELVITVLVVSRGITKNSEL